MLAHGLRDRGLQIVFVLVVFVLAVGDDAGRRRHRQEALFRLHALERGFEIVDVALQLGLPRILDRPGADRLAHRRHAFFGVELGIEVGELGAVGAALERIGGLLLDRPALEAGEARERVLRP